MPITEQDLAINGGAPVRTEPFPPWPHVEEPERAAVHAVLESDDLHYHKGPNGIAFERAFADWVGVTYGLAVCNGGSALHCALAACGAGPGDEVIVPPLTFVATCVSPLWTNAVPVFADIDRETLNIDPASIAERITERTRAIVAVHMHGRACDMDAIMALADEHDLFVIEDCAQSHGATWKGEMTGSIGHIAAYSFCQNKHMTTGGEGGIVLTNDLELARRARAVAHYGILYDRPGEDGRWVGMGGGRDMIGWNMRMSEMQSAYGLAVLERLDEIVEGRRELAAHYDAGLADVACLTPVPEGAHRKHSYFRYDCLFDPRAVTCTRNQFVSAVSAEGVKLFGTQNATNYLDPVFRNQRGYGGTDCPFGCPWYEGAADYEPGLCPVSEEMGERIVQLEVYSTITTNECDDTLAAIRKVEEAYRA